MLVSATQLQKESNQIMVDEEASLNENKKVVQPIISDKEKALLKTITSGNLLGKNTNLVKRKEMISAKGFEPVEFAYERAIGINNSLYSNFTELIALTKRKVTRIVLIEDGKKIGYATGFMVSPNLLLTNWHVFKNVQAAKESELHFFYEYNVNGHPLTPVIFTLDTTHFFNDENLDYCFVGVRPMDMTNKVSLQSIGYLYLDKALGKIGDVNVERLNIIHHPQGDLKQISIRENTFVGINDTKIFYETDTAQGSSGSPVFNDQWQVVGLHHKSIAKMSADNKNYLDKDNKIIPIVNDTIDVTKIIWLKNEGIRISVILKHLFEKNPTNSIINSISIAPPSENLFFHVHDDIQQIENKNINMTTNNQITINIPTDALSTEQTIDISISQKKINIPDVAITQKTSTTESNELVLELAKIDREKAMDFTLCKGYDPDFLGVKILLPQPKKIIEKQIAFLKNKKIELKYFKYSVLFNAVTKMPLISAVNVEGDIEKRLDNSKRSDTWLRDVRIPIEYHLTDKFYEGSHFDKGHMSRFEDANWDTTEEKALRNGEYTCFYTNACPQVVKLNRGAGLWGKLEKLILEKGVKKEAGILAKISVFNGPIFNEEKDRVFRGVTIPMEFFKVIVWLNDAKKIRATAFKLSQETIVDVISFDESMVIDDEAIDIDKDIAFKEYQISIKKLSRLTKIDFKHIEKYDTFLANNGSEERFIINEKEVFL